MDARLDASGVYDRRARVSKDFLVVLFVGAEGYATSAGSGLGWSISCRLPAGTGLGEREERAVLLPLLESLRSGAHRLLLPSRRSERHGAARSHRGARSGGPGRFTGRWGS